MKTYNYIYALAVFIIIGCSKSDEGSGLEGEGLEKSVEANYVVLLKNDNSLSTQFLNANAETTTLNPTKSSLPQNSIPQLTSINGTTLLQYHQNSDCAGNITKHDFATDQSTKIDLFDDLKDCELNANAMTFTETSLYIAYDMEVDSKTAQYKVRAIDLISDNFSFEDIFLSKKPVGLTVANNRLFILTIDQAVSQENFLYVLDLETNELIHEIKLGLRARRIFRNDNENIVISYDNLHTTLNSTTMAQVFTNYEPGKEPKFAYNTFDNFDSEGRLYYTADAGTNSTYNEVTAVYDFEQNLTTLYIYENILTEAQRNFEFDIETTTAVSYDEENNRILIGYKKRNEESGGILRIKPAPNATFIDHHDLEGIPFAILIN